MPKYGDYCCPTCHAIYRECPVPFGVKFTEHVLRCSQCGSQADNGYIPPVLEWIPQLGRVSAGNGPTFTAFETTDPRGNLVRINSITELRAMERESEKMAKDGVGQQMVWRDYANGISNKDEHAIHKRWEADDYPGTPTKEQFAQLRQLTTKEGEARVADAERVQRDAASPAE